MEIIQEKLVSMWFWKTLYLVFAWSVTTFVELRIVFPWLKHPPSEANFVTCFENWNSACALFNQHVCGKTWDDHSRSMEQQHVLNHCTEDDNTTVQTIGWYISLTWFFHLHVYLDICFYLISAYFRVILRPITGNYTGDTRDGWWKGTSHHAQLAQRCTTRLLRENAGGLRDREVVWRDECHFWGKPCIANIFFYTVMKGVW